MRGLPGILYIDTFEPQLIVSGLEPIMSTVVAPINTWDKADYYWVDPQGNERMVERKQISEALSDLEAVEEQLGRHLRECAELTLLVEGVAMPTSTGVQTYDHYNQGDTIPHTNHQWKSEGWHKGHTHSKQPKLYSRWHSFKYSLWHNAGIHVEEVSHWKGSIEYIATAFEKSMNPSNTTMNRYVVPHMPPFDKNPHIDNLCRLKDMGLGEKNSIRLIEELGTFHGVMTAPYSTLVGIMGGAWTKKFLKAIGREN